MGMAKYRMMEEEERRFGSINSIVCQNCVGNMALKQYIIDNRIKDECHYCESTDLCVNVEYFIGEIMDGINYEYDDALNEMMICNLKIIY